MDATPETSTSDAARPASAWPSGWHTTQRGLKVVLYSFLFVPLFFLGLCGLRILVLSFIPGALFGLAGSIQCAFVPDSRARGLMVGVVFSVLGQPALLFAEDVILTGMPFASQLLHWLYVMHVLFALVGFVLLLQFIRRVAEIFGDVQLSNSARTLLLCVLGWVGAAIGVGALNFVMKLEGGALQGISVVFLQITFLVPLFCVFGLFSLLARTRSVILRTTTGQEPVSIFR